MRTCGKGSCHRNTAICSAVYSARSRNEAINTHIARDMNFSVIPAITSNTSNNPNKNMFTSEKTFSVVVPNTLATGAPETSALTNIQQTNKQKNASALLLGIVTFPSCMENSNKKNSAKKTVTASTICLVSLNGWRENGNTRMGNSSKKA